MLETSVRLLRLLSLLQSRRDWSGAGLAAELGVTTRTVRNDVERLRILGYQVRSTTGTAGGYRLGAGTALPPLLLDDEEAVAVAVGLRAAAAATVTGIEDTSLRALAKLEQTLPARLRHRIDALRSVTVSAAGGGPTVDADTLAAIANASHNHERLRFDYLAQTAGRRPAASSRTGWSTPDAGGTCWPGLAAYLTSLDVDFQVIDPPELRDLLRRLAARYTTAATPVGEDVPDESAIRGAGLARDADG
jgi:biotin operon repressor